MVTKDPKGNNRATNGLSFNSLHNPIPVTNVRETVKSDKIKFQVEGTVIQFIHKIRKGVSWKPIKHIANQIVLIIDLLKAENTFFLQPVQIS